MGLRNDHPAVEYGAVDRGFEQYTDDGGVWNKDAPGCRRRELWSPVCHLGLVHSHTSDSKEVPKKSIVDVTCKVNLHENPTNPSLTI